MAKKKASKRNNNVKKIPLKLIDNVPKYSQQPRSSPQKRRTDFSPFFFRNSASSSNSGSLLDSSCVRIALFCKTAQREEISPSTFVRCTNNSPDEGLRLSSDFSEASVLDAGMGNNPNDLSEFHNHREVSDLGNEASLSVWSGVVLREISSEGLVKNNPVASNSSDEHDLSSDKSVSSVASKTSDDLIERGRGKRERRPKVHFGDINITMAVKPEGQIRRLRIMRYLGLTPPIGSPFQIGLSHNADYKSV